MYYFNERHLKELRATVRANRQKINRATRPIPELPKDYSLWAFLGDTDGTGKYSWLAAFINADGTMEQDSDQGWGDCDENTGFAMCIHGKSIYCLEGSLVLLRPALTLNCFVFNYHEHRTAKTTDSVIAATGPNHPGQGPANIYLDDSETQSVIIKNPYNENLQEDTGVTVEFRQDGNWYITGANCDPY